MFVNNKKNNLILSYNISTTKQFFKALPSEGRCFKNFCDYFTGLSIVRLKKSVFERPNIWKLMKNENVYTKMERNV